MIFERLKHCRCFLLAIIASVGVTACGGEDPEPQSEPVRTNRSVESEQLVQPSEAEEIPAEAVAYEFSTFENADRDFQTALVVGDVSKAQGIWYATPLDRRYELTQSYQEVLLKFIQRGDPQRIATITPFIDSVEDEIIQVTEAHFERLHPKATLSGKVTNKATGEPIEGVEVISGASRTRTDSAGHYQLEGVPEGDRAVVAMSYPDWSDESTRIDFLPNQHHQHDFELSATEKKPELEVPTVFGDVELVVLDADTNEPLVDVPVVIATKYDMVNVLFGKPSHAGNTDEAGRIKLDHVPAGVHSLLVAFPPKYLYSDEKFEVPENQLRSETIRIKALGGRLELPAVVAGVVRDQETGEPIRNARVGVDTLNGTSTDADGRFSHNTLPGEKTLSVSHAGYYLYEQTVTLIAKEVVEVEIELQPATTGSVLGVVIHAQSGEPLVGALVGSGAQTTRTNEQGQFVLENVTAGSALISASLAGFEGASQTVALEVLGVAQAELKMEPITTGTVSGRVISAADNSPVMDAAVSAGALTANTDSDGRFTIELVPQGTVTVVADKILFEPKTHSIELEALATENVELVLTPITYGDIVGTVHDAVSGGGLKDVQVTLSGQRVMTDEEGAFEFKRAASGDLMLGAGLAKYHDSLEQITLRPGETLTHDIDLDPITTGTMTGTVIDSDSGSPMAGAVVSWSGGSARTDETGRFEFVEVPAGEVSVRAEKPVFEPAAVTAQLEAAGTTEIELALKPITYGELSGTVVDASSGQPIGGARVSAAAQQATTDSQGRFLFERIDAGELQVSASKAVYESDSTAATVEAAKSTDVNLQLTPITYGAISGQVVNAVSEQPLAGAAVSVQGHSIKSDAEGRFTFEKINAGSASVMATMHAYHAGSKSIELRPDSSVEVELRLDPITTGDVIGQVIDASTRKPVFGARVSLAGQAMETSAVGRFEFAKVQAGSVGVSVRHVDYKDGGSSGQLEGAATLELVVEMALRREDVTELESALSEHGVIDLYGIHFDSAQDQFKPSSLSTLQALLQVMQRSPDQRYQIAGHTDSDGDNSYNQNLSERRAATVTAWLVDNGIASDRLSGIGFGETQPAAPNETESGKALNRRVQVIVVE